MTNTQAPVLKMGVREYLESLVSIIRSPSSFFEDTTGESGSRRALIFLMISGLFYCSVSMTYFFENSLIMGVVMMANAVFMPALGACFSFCIIRMMTTSRVSYSSVFNIYAYSSGAVMVISWIPGLAVVMEPVRAILVGVGLYKTGKLGRLRAFMTVTLTAVLLLLFFWTIAPLVVALRDSYGSWAAQISVTTYC
ncbi:YIP1 family protein [Maridesulfovibrio sp.]|uniref:YIP1 family protein n=1 Tax=Maridesulfovibrio sp. TaxID=2795000 RepID=UPI0029F5A774|nr:YIP1 family protein [Maridesulfovibrio sp.]